MSHSALKWTYFVAKSRSPSSSPVINTCQPNTRIITRPKRGCLFWAVLWLTSLSQAALKRSPSVSTGRGERDALNNCYIFQRIDSFAAIDSYYLSLIYLNLFITHYTINDLFKKLILKNASHGIIIIIYSRNILFKHTHQICALLVAGTDQAVPKSSCGPLTLRETQSFKTYIEDKNKIV